MPLLATAQCVEFEQRIYADRKETTESVYSLYLYDDRLVIKNESIPLVDIFDISYRKESDGDAIGFLYVHTRSGMRAFLIKEKPTELLNEFKQIK